jgi:catechol 2,3-dioxygenase-like lactoylglutathione lyase family enzyme
VTSGRAGAVLYASDTHRLQAFYESVCGLEVVESTSEYVILASEVWELTLVAVPEDVAATLTLTDPPRRRTQTPIKLVFGVGSLAKARSAAAVVGGMVDPAEWTFADALVCDGQDPEGNVVQFRTPRPAAAAAPAANEA